MEDEKNQRIVMDAIERDSFSDEPQISRRADESFALLMKHQLPDKDFQYYLERGIEWRQLHEDADESLEDPGMKP